jgi:hypothetical protein
MQRYLTFKDVAERMRSPDVRIQVHLPYKNKLWLEGTTVGFSHFCEWFEVNIHDAKGMSWDDALRLITSSPDTELNSSDPDKYGNARWFGGAWVSHHHVRVWYNPQAF